MKQYSDIFLKIAISGMLISLLNFLCNYNKTDKDFKINSEKFRPFQPLGIVKPQNYEDVIKIAFDKLSSGEKVPDIKCAVKLDLTPEESHSLKTYILDQLRKTINTTPTPSRISPMIGEEFSIIDLVGFYAKNNAVVTFTLFHKRRYFAIQCRAIATKNTSVGQATQPWFIHKIQYASEDMYDRKSNVTGMPKDKNIGTKLENDKLEINNVGYPELLEPLLNALQESIPQNANEIQLSNLTFDSKTMTQDDIATMTPNNATNGYSVVAGTNIFGDGIASASLENVNNPSSVNLSNVTQLLN